MSTIWPWSSPACATSGIEIRKKRKAQTIIFILLAIAISILMPSVPASASVIQAGTDVQTAINSAKAGDTIIVGPGEVSRFQVDRPLTIEGQGDPTVSAALQKPAIKVLSDDVTITGFHIIGVGKDTTAKFNYYMQNPTAAAGSSFDEPNTALVIKGNGFSMKNCTFFGAQLAISAENVHNLVLQNNTINSCDTGALIQQSSQIRVTGCHIKGCKKYGLDIEKSSDVTLDNNSIVNNTNGGILLKETDENIVQDNILSMNTFGLSLWKSSSNQVRRNQADHNYYGILLTASSDYNNLTDNLAEDNSRSDIVSGFGIGISLQENSSYNILIRNTAKGNFNGLEISRGCKYNAVYDNNASDNEHGIRLNENRNNLIIANNFFRNKINAYENTSLNIWNTTIGNYYNDYQGKDANEDGIGDQPYSLPGPESHSFDYRPLIRPFRDAVPDRTQIREEVKEYAVFPPSDYEYPTISKQKGVVVISRKTPSTPPKWTDSRAFDASAPPFQKENTF
jgi:nitrous oxidase accessory protein